MLGLQEEPGEGGGGAAMSDASECEEAEKSLHQILSALSTSITEKRSLQEAKVKMEGALAEHQKSLLRLREADGRRGMELEALKSAMEVLKKKSSEREDALLKEMEEMRRRHGEDIDRISQSKSHAIEDIERSYSEALRTAQGRTQEVREAEREAAEKATRLDREVEGLRAQLRQCENERNYQASCLEEERKSFNRFREEAQRKKAELERRVLELETKDSELQSKNRTLQLDLQAERTERERLVQSLREEIQSLTESREKARKEAGHAFRSTEHANEESMQAKAHAAQLTETVKRLQTSLAQVGGELEGVKAAKSQLERERQSEMESLEELRRALSLRQQDLKDKRLRALDRLVSFRKGASPAQGEENRPVNGRDSPAGLPQSPKEGNEAAREARYQLSQIPKFVPSQRPETSDEEEAESKSGQDGSSTHEEPLSARPVPSDTSPSPPRLEQRWNEERIATLGRREVRGLTEVYVVSARNLPERFNENIAVEVNLQGQMARTRASVAGKLEWHAHFRLPSEDPNKDLVLFDLIKTSRRELIGRVAIPLNRVVRKGREAGWYELRNQSGHLVKSESGEAAMLQIGCAVGSSLAAQQRG
ncbi:hypothetical protein GUITHDRAFT_112627 [Guillardia theta CCMP2712]|uniref:C2 domain-containing protein n=1 Tax=Guillardia theta (strain CCMP2712) TaxID=905079 RepID=L1IZA8_GUITC|nr:hypothetical protein GUITHDRAFT_112627 [Guillardia theta CCMP2712]EKX41412.1 hypothetical protein GUITHDRAFT_112627 [Guillardia theta CCMP2712]|eukprot:XP_005828392.1 hypothetical protein GUITHDRAFT_112627 [Guillardia theta CCMP2712]